MAVAISKWRTPEDKRPASGLIGPNAVLQTLTQLERIGGKDRVERMLRAADIAQIPDGTAMIPEDSAARLHRLLREEEPDLAPTLATAAGRDTARYILAHRIPKPAQAILRALPAPLAARALSRAIASHAWTFAGSGQFNVLTPWTFQITDNPVIRGETSALSLCDWHAAVFEHLYRRLVHPDCRCRETSCGAQPGQMACRFHIERETAPVG